MTTSDSPWRFDDWNAAQEYYFANGLTDGLPVIPPTPERVQAMLDYAGVSADHDLGTEIIRQKRFTAGKAAVNAVMAGCLPEHFPVVLASLSAITERAFNLHASSTSTNGATVLTLVSGPYADAIGMNAGVELMGNGSRANAAIGRAVNLFKANFYGSAPVTMDNSTFGHPGKIGFCFPENRAVSPWPALAAERGYGDDATIVTAYARLGAAASYAAWRPQPGRFSDHRSPRYAGLRAGYAGGYLRHQPGGDAAHCRCRLDAGAGGRVSARKGAAAGVGVGTLASDGAVVGSRPAGAGGSRCRPHYRGSRRRDGGGVHQPD